MTSESERLRRLATRLRRRAEQLRAMDSRATVVTGALWDEVDALIIELEEMAWDGR